MSDAPRELAQSLHVLRGPVVGDLQTQQRLRIVGVREQPAVGVEQSAALLQVDVDPFPARDRGARFVECQAEQATILAGQREPPAIVERHADPAALVGLRDADERHCESRSGPDSRPA